VHAAHEDGTMSLHVVLMALAIGAAHPSAAANPQPPTPMVFVTCVGGTTIDLRAVEWPTPVWSTIPITMHLPAGLCNSVAPSLDRRVRGGIPADLQPARASTAPATAPGLRAPHHLLRAAGHSLPSQYVAPGAGKRPIGHPGSTAAAAPRAAISRDAAITTKPAATAAAPPFADGHRAVPIDEDTDAASTGPAPRLDGGASLPTPMPSFEGPVHPQAYQTPQRSSASSDRATLSLRLPTGGEHPYVTPDQKSGEPVRLKGGRGFLDRKGNRWVPDRTKPGEWDVQHPNGTHTNVGEDGSRTHGKDEFPGHKASHADAGHSGWWWLAPAAVAAGALLAAPVTDGGSLLLLPAGA
jgi:hypothetical protein